MIRLQKLRNSNISTQVLKVRGKGTYFSTAFFIHRDIVIKFAHTRNEMQNEPETSGGAIPFVRLLLCPLLFTSFIHSDS